MKSIIIKFSHKKPDRVGIYLIQKRPDDDPSMEEVYVGRDSNGNLWAYGDYDNFSLDSEMASYCKWSSRILVR
jgi:hypothetical protein